MRKQSPKKRSPKKSKDSSTENAKEQGFDHKCFWRTAAVKLASCVVWTLQTDGKLGVGSGMVMKVVDGKKTIERWDKQFIEALNFIGIEVGEKPSRKQRQSKRPSAIQTKKQIKEQAA